MHYGGVPLASRVEALESTVGIERWEFEYRIPPGYTLFATFQAELDGKPLPGMSATYHVVPSWPSEETNGEVDVLFNHPEFQTKLPQRSTWTVSLAARNERNDLFWRGGSSKRTGNSFFNDSPIDPSTYTGLSGRGEDSGWVASLDPGREHEVWEYTCSGHPSFEGNEEPFNFKYSLSVRMEPLKPDDELGSVSQVDPGEEQ